MILVGERLAPPEEALLNCAVKRLSVGESSRIAGERGYCALRAVIFVYDERYSSLVSDIFASQMRYARYASVILVGACVRLALMSSSFLLCSISKKSSPF